RPSARGSPDGSATEPPSAPMPRLPHSACIRYRTPPGPPPRKPERKTMNEPRITLSIENGVADVRLARPDKLNALDHAMFEELAAMGERLKTAPGLRAVVLSGEGRAFCAGLDMESFKEMAGGPDEALLARMKETTPGGANP